MRNYPLERGIPARKLIEDRVVLGTYSSCVRAKQVFGVTKVIMVSQTFHLPRALATCRAIGLEAWGVGDQTVMTNSGLWTYGTLRELGANLEMVWDVISQRKPELGARDRSVDGPSAADCALAPVERLRIGADPVLAADAVDRQHVVVAEFEVEDVEVLDHALAAVGLGEDDVAGLQVPADDDLRRGLAVCLRPRR